MKYIRQLAVILGISFLGEILHYLIPFPIPGSVYGLILMFLLLVRGILKIEDVRETGQFLIEIMPLMFIPAAAGLAASWGQVKTMLVPACVITVISTVVVMATAGNVTEACIRRQEEGVIRQKEEGVVNQYGKSDS